MRIAVLTCWIGCAALASELSAFDTVAGEILAATEGYVQIRTGGGDVSVSDCSGGPIGWHAEIQVWAAPNQPANVSRQCVGGWVFEPIRPVEPGRTIRLCYRMNGGRQLRLVRQNSANRVRVLLAPDRTPVAGLDIQLNGPYQTSVRTDAEGFFQTSGLGPGKYVLTPLWHGHRPAQGKGWVLWLGDRGMDVLWLERYGKREQAVEAMESFKGMIRVIPEVVSDYFK